MSNKTDLEHITKKKKPFRKRLYCVLVMIVILAVIVPLGINLYQSAIYTFLFSDSGQEALEEVRLVRVVDGDTIVVEQGGEEVRVRLLCVNCEESVHPDESKNTEKGKEASAFTSDYLADYSMLYLQYDEERYDQYDRTLAYVWLSDDVNVNSEEDIKNYMLNAILLEKDMATVVVYEPNHRYADLFYELEKNE